MSDAGPKSELVGPLEIILLLRCPDSVVMYVSIGIFGSKASKNKGFDYKRE